MEPSLHIVKSLSQRRREEEDVNLQMFIRNRKRSSRQMLEEINEDVELAEAMALAGVILSKKPRLTSETFLFFVFFLAAAILFAFEPRLHATFFC